MEDAPECDAEPEAADPDAQDFTFGVTLDQIDALDRLIQTMSAHGDAIAVSDTAELADHTVPLLGQAICDGIAAVRDLLDQVEAQRLEAGRDGRSRVREAREAYAVGPAVQVDGRVLSASAPRPALHALLPHGQRLH